MFLKSFFADLIKINIEKIHINCHCRNHENNDCASKNKGEIKMSFNLDVGQAPVTFGATFSDIQDANGNAVSRSEIKVNVRTSDDSVLGSSYDESTDTGAVTPRGVVGESSFTLEAVDKDEPDQVLATYSNNFRFFAGNPESIGAINVAFDGITES